MNSKLFEACAAGDYSTVSRLVTSENVNKKDNRGSTLLRVALYNGHVDIAGLLCDTGADLFDPERPIINSQEYIRSIKFILDGIYMRNIDSFMDSNKYLRYAVDYDYTELEEYYLENMDLNIITEGYTILDGILVGVYNDSSVNCVRFLIKLLNRGAKFTLKEHNVIYKINLDIYEEMKSQENFNDWLVLNKNAILKVRDTTNISEVKEFIESNI